MTPDSAASITYRVEVDPLEDGANQIFEKQQSFSVSKQGPFARTVVLNSDRYAIKYDSDGVETPAGQTVTLTAVPFNHTGTVFYEFFVEGVSIAPPSTTDNILLDDADEPQAGETKTYKVQTRIDSASNPVQAEDSISIYGVQDGADGVDASGAVIVIDQTANENGWYNENITWRLLFEESVFNAEYRVWKDADGEPGT